MYVMSILETGWRSQDFSQIPTSGNINNINITIDLEYKYVYNKIVMTYTLVKVHLAETQKQTILSYSR